MKYSQEQQDRLICLLMEASSVLSRIKKFGALRPEATVKEQMERTLDKIELELDR